MKSNNNGSLFNLFLFVFMFSTININTFNLYIKISLWIPFVMTFIIYLKNKINLMFIYLLLSVIFFTLIVLPINSNSFGSIMTLISSLLAVFLYSKNNISNFKPMLILFILFNLFWNVIVLFSTVGINTFRGFNTNTIGLFLSVSYMVLFILFNKYKFKGYQFISIVLFVINIMSINKTISRSSLIIVVVFMFLTLFKNIFAKLQLRKVIVPLFFILGIIVPLLYVYLYNNNINFNIPFYDKRTFSGREIIWSNYFDYISKNKLFLFVGSGSKQDFWVNRDLNMHSFYLTVLNNYGLIIYLLYFLIFLIIANRNKNKNNELFSIMFLSLLLLSLFETTFLWTAVYPLIYSVFLLRNIFNEEKNDN